LLTAVCKIAVSGKQYWVGLAVGITVGTGVGDLVDLALARFGDLVDLAFAA